jgi:pimeloyl-ACP methyl ester carboxylesterase
VLNIDGGWAFKFDTDLLENVTGAARDDAERDLHALALPLGVIHGADSELFSGRTLAHMRTLRGGDFPAVAIPDARHHLFLDQPHAFAQVLERMVAELAG